MVLLKVSRTLNELFISIIYLEEKIKAIIFFIKIRELKAYHEFIVSLKHTIFQ